MTEREEIKAAHARIGRLEERVDNHQAKLGNVAEDVSWIKGYLQKQPKVLSNGRAVQRDAGLVAGGGGIVGGLMILIEKLFGG